MEALKSVGAIIIDYSSHERTRKYLVDLVSASDIPIKCIVIVDNSPCIENSINIASAFMLPEINLNGITDDTHNYHVDKVFKGVYKDTEIILLHSADNKGFASGNNLGFIVLQKIYSVDYVIFTNNDILFCDNEVKLSQLINVFSEDPCVGAVGPAVIGLDEKHQTPCKYIGLFDRVWKNIYLDVMPFFRSCKSDVITTPERGYVYRIIGAFFIVDAYVFSKIGMFDENTFLYAEELILADRLRKQGYEVFYEPCLSVIHEGGYTTKRAGRVNVKNLVKIRKAVIKSNIYYYEKYRDYNKLFIMLTTFMGEIHCMLLGIKLIFHNFRGKKE